MSIILNDLFSMWLKEKSKDNLETLLKEVTKRVHDRYKGIDENCEDISQETALYVWRMLVGSSIGKGLAPFNPERGDFAAYVATRARTLRLNLQEREELFDSKEEWQIEAMVQEEEDKW